jgi:hypothetical protein
MYLDIFLYKYVFYVYIYTQVDKGLHSGRERFAPSEFTTNSCGTSTGRQTASKMKGFDVSLNGAAR